MEGYVISKVCLKESKISRHVKRGRDTKIPQSSGPPVKVGDEAVHKELGDKMERAATIASSLEAEQDNAKEIAGLKKRVQKLERKKKSRTTGLQRLRKVGESSRGRLDDAEMFDIDDLHGDEVFVDMAVVTTTDEGVIAAKIDKIIPTSAPTTVIDELTLAQTLIEIKAAKFNLLTKGFDAGRFQYLVSRVWVTECKRAATTASSIEAEQLAVHKELGDRMERAVTTAYSLEAEHNNESSIRSDLHLADAGGIDCLLTATIFEELAWMGKGFSRRVTSLFATMMVQATQDEGVDSGIPTDSQQTPITTQPSSSRPQKKQSRRRQRKETEVPQDETHHDDSVPIPSNDLLLSGEDRMQLTELMILCTNLQKQVLDLEKVKDAQAKEIAVLKKRVQKLERKKK
ncbi:hypothetical protein Tco_1561233 [Tanacetum coccineum]